ncbi:50S ribosomal protein L22 [Candidatus Falkowbacteria bacterium]|jgi:large subunit ribosomal protein L22|nr:50S ribosomal protein L22 [Candidatus Falkowbacteria bacterium]
MEVKASLKHLRMSPRKTRLVIDVIRKMPVNAALDQLKFINKRAAAPIAGLVKSAVANAVNTYNLEADNLYIKEIRSDEAATLKRWMPKAHGRATSIRKRGCHLSIVIAEIKESGKAEKKVVKTADPIKLEKLVAESEKSAKGVKKVATEKGAEVIDPRMEGRASKKESSKGHAAKMFRRKAG